MKLIQPGEARSHPGYVCPTACRRWADTIIESRDRWHASMDHHHFGLAYYVELTSGRVANYHACAQSVNDRVQSALPGYVERMTSVAELLDTPYGQPMPARPRGPRWVSTGLSVNDTEEDVDGQETDPRFGKGHMDVEGLAGEPDLMFSAHTRAFSACLSVATPASGGGLFVGTGRRVHQAGYAPGPKDPVELFEYRPGTLTVFDSLLWHRIQGIKTSPEAPYRIVGVIHFLFDPNPADPHWVYWY